MIEPMNNRSFFLFLNYHFLKKHVAAVKENETEIISELLDKLDFLLLNLSVCLHPRLSFLARFPDFILSSSLSVRLC